MSKGTLSTFGDVVDWRFCIGCGACAYVCKKGAVRMVHVESEGYRPIFDDPSCHDCTDCIDICPSYQLKANLTVGSLPHRSETDREFGQTLEIWEGWASDTELRFRGSSGGVLSALSLYCLEVGGFDGIVHSGMDHERPWLNQNYLSRSREQILAQAGSRYSPSTPCFGLREIKNREGLYAFIGKPCDTAAVSELRERDEQVGTKIGLVLTFFCAGTPSTQGTLNLVRKIGVDLERITAVHYRGDGWPGEFRITSREPEDKRTMSYAESWRMLTAYRPLRCNVCPDGLGRIADISCGDAWHQYGNGEDAGRSLVLVRTPRGQDILAKARQMGYVTLRRVGPEAVMSAQPNLLARRKAVFGRLLAFRLLGVPIPNFKGFLLFRGWLNTGVAEQLTTVLGTLRRIVRRGWFRRRRLPGSSSGTTE